MQIGMKGIAHGPNPLKYFASLLRQKLAYEELDQHPIAPSVKIEYSGI
jgi:hypothetical protein